MSYTEHNLKVLNKFIGRTDLRIILGAINTGIDLLRHKNNFDICISIFEEQDDNKCDLSDDAIIKQLIVDFNSNEMINICNYLSFENPLKIQMVKKIVFDFSTVKFYNGTTTRALYSTLVHDGILIIESRVYLRFIPRTTDEIRTCQFHLGNIINNKKEITGKQWSSNILYLESIPEVYKKIVFTEEDLHNSNQLHLENNGFIVTKIKGEYPITLYPEEGIYFKQYNKSILDTTYFIANKI